MIDLEVVGVENISNQRVGFRQIVVLVAAMRKTRNDYLNVPHEFVDRQPESRP